MGWADDGSNTAGPDRLNSKGDGMKTKKKAAKPRAERTYTLTMSAGDLDHLHWVLEGEVEMQRDMMNTPDPKAKPERQLEDWAIGREFMLRAMRLKQMIEKVYKPKRGGLKRC